MEYGEHDKGDTNYNLFREESSKTEYSTVVSEDPADAVG